MFTQGKQNTQINKPKITKYQNHRLTNPGEPHKNSKPTNQRNTNKNQNPSL